MEKYKDKQWLKEKYINERLSPYDLAKICSCGSNTIRHWLKTFNIQIRNRSEAAKIAHEQKGHGFQEGNQIGNKYKKGNQWRFKKGNVIGKETRFVKINEDNYIKSSYSLFHKAVNQMKEIPKVCEICKKEKKLQLSFNHKLGEHTDNPKDYKYLCKKCHFQRDKEFGCYVLERENKKMVGS